MLLLLLCLPSADPPAPASRTFLFTYSATITGLPRGEKVRLWAPVPRPSAHQDVRFVRGSVAGREPAAGTIAAEPAYGNRIYHAEVEPTDAGEVTLTFVYRVTRREARGATPITETPDQLKRLLQPDALVPLKGKPLDLIKGKKLPDDPTARAKDLYTLVNGHMKYSKDTPGWGRGDSAWACDSKTGNCSDFHSLFISLVRSQKLPARFEMGFPIPDKKGAGTVGGYHCWAFFSPSGKTWVPVDISEANKDPKMANYYFGNLTPDRVTFSTGRDITLVPKQAGKPVNYLIYPYVEVAGREWPQDRIKKTFLYRDVEE